MNQTEELSIKITRADFSELAAWRIPVESAEIDHPQETKQDFIHVMNTPLHSSVNILPRISFSPVYTPTIL